MILLLSALISIGPKLPELPKGNPEDITKFVAKVDTVTAGAKSLVSGTLENLVVTGQVLLGLESVGADQKAALQSENDKALGAIENLKGVDIGNPDSLAKVLKDGKSIASEYMGLITTSITAEGAASAVSGQKEAIQQFLDQAVTDAASVVNKAGEAVALAPNAAKAKGMGAAKDLTMTTTAGNTLDEGAIGTVVDKGAGFAKDMSGLVGETSDIVKAYQKVLSGL